MLPLLLYAKISLIKSDKILGGANWGKNLMRELSGLMMEFLMKNLNLMLIGLILCCIQVVMSFYIKTMHNYVSLNNLAEELAANLSLSLFLTSLS